MSMQPLERQSEKGTCEKKQVQSVTHYTSQQLSQELFNVLREQVTFTTVTAVPLKIEAQRTRQWGWWGKRGWRVRLHLVNEQGKNWCFSQFVTKLQEFAIACATAEKDPVWHCHVLADEQAGDRGEAETPSFWTGQPFIMF